MSEGCIFIYKDGFCQDFVIAYQRLIYNHIFKFLIPITEPIDWEIDEFDIWYEEIYEKCPNRDIPNEYMDLDDYYKNPEKPKMTKNTEKWEMCLEKGNTDDYSCCYNECPKRE